MELESTPFKARQEAHGVVTEFRVFDEYRLNTEVSSAAGNELKELGGYAVSAIFFANEDEFHEHVAFFQIQAVNASEYVPVLKD